MKSSHEKIIKRDDGSRVKIVISLNLDYPLRSTVNYRLSVALCEAKKRTWKAPTDENDHIHRLLSMDDSQLRIQANYLKHVTLEEILSVKLELWQSIKPEL